MNEMNDNLESYECGKNAGADFCFTETNKAWDDVNQVMMYSCNELAFSTDGFPEGGHKNPGPLLWKNTISALVLLAAEDPEPVVPDPVDPEPVEPEDPVVPDPDPVDPPPTTNDACVTTFYSGYACSNSPQGYLTQLVELGE